MEQDSNGNAELPAQQVDPQSIAARYYSLRPVIVPHGQEKDTVRILGVRIIGGDVVLADFFDADKKPVKIGKAITTKKGWVLN